MLIDEARIRRRSEMRFNLLMNERAYQTSQRKAPMNEFEKTKSVVESIINSTKKIEAVITHT